MMATVKITGDGRIYSVKESESILEIQPDGTLLYSHKDGGEIRMKDGVIEVTGRLVLGSTKAE